MSISRMIRNRAWCKCDRVHFSPLLTEPDKLHAMEREAGALLQYFNNGLLNSQLYDPK